MTNTYTLKASDIDRRWYIVDAANVPLGRLATATARLLSGKHKPSYSPNLDNGDFVIVVNASESVLTGRKELQKIYYRHSGQPGKLKEETAERLRARKPQRMVELAVRGMLPKTKMGRQQLRKLKVYSGADHPHSAQQPETFVIGSKMASAS